MSDVSYGVNDAETVKLWGRKLDRESVGATFMKKFMGDDSNSIIQIRDDTSKGPGDRIRTTLRVQLSGSGVQGDSTLEGSEEDLTTYTDDTVINQLRHAVRSGGRMSEQRIPFSVREEARLGLKDWWAKRYDVSIFNQLAGNTAQTDTKFTGNNSVTAADSSHLFRSGAVTIDENLSATETMSLALIDKLVMNAKTVEPLIRPVMVGGNPFYVMFLHPGQVKALRTDTSTGDWLDLQKSAMQGGDVKNNPIFTGALGIYNQTILHESLYIPKGIHSTTGLEVANTRRAVFCGAQAATFCTGRENGGAKMTWFEEMFDYGNKLGVSAGQIFGCKRSIYNSATFGSFVAGTYSEV